MLMQPWYITNTGLAYHCEAEITWQFKQLQRNFADPQPTVFPSYPPD